MLKWGEKTMEISFSYPLLCVFETFLKEKLFLKKDKAGVQGCKSSFVCLFFCVCFLQIFERFYAIDKSGLQICGTI